MTIVSLPDRAVHKPTLFSIAGMALRWPGQWAPRCTAVRPCWRQWKASSQRSWSWCLYWKKATWTWPNGTLAGFGWIFVFLFVFFSGFCWFLLLAHHKSQKKQRETTNRWYGRHIIVHDGGKRHGRMLAGFLERLGLVIDIFWKPWLFPPRNGRSLHSWWRQSEQPKKKTTVDSRNPGPPGM